MARIGKRMPRLIMALFAFIAWTSLAQAGVVTGELDKAEGTLEDQFVYTLAVQGSVDKEPEFPKIEGLDVQKAGTSQSVSMVNGHFSREVQYQFALTPQREGSFTIPAIRVKVDDGEQATLPLQLTIKADAANAASDHSDQPVFVERSFSKQKAYMGESLVATVRIYNRVRLYGASPEIEYPASFQARPIEGQKNSSKMINGEEYGVTEINTVLTPNQAGTFKLDPAVLNAKIAAGKRRSRSMLDDWMNQTEVAQKRFRSPEATIEVLPLPLEGRRQDFSGLVGSFTLDAEVSRREAQVGETITLTLTVAGEGTTAGMAEPDLKLGDSVKVYKDKPQSLDEVDSSSGMRGRRVYKFALVPTRAGAIDLGGLQLQYFDSKVGAYRDLTAELGRVEVKGTEGAPAVADEPAQPATPKSSPKEVSKLAEDLIEPHGDDRLWESQVASSLELASGGGVSLASGLVLLGLVWQRKRLENAGQRGQRRRASQALRTLQLRLQAAEKQIEREPRTAMIEVQRALKAYVADKLAVSTESLTLKELEGLLRVRQLPEASVQKLPELWRALEKIIFASNQPEPKQASELLHTTEKLLKEVDKSC